MMWGSPSGKDHHVPGGESYALAIQQPSRGVPFGEQMVDDYVSCIWSQVGRDRAGGRRTETPRRRKVSVIKHGPLKLHNL